MAKLCESAYIQGSVGVVQGLIYRLLLPNKKEKQNINRKEGIQKRMKLTNCCHVYGNLTPDCNIWTGNIRFHRTLLQFSAMP